MVQIEAIKFERTQIHFFAHVFAAVVVVLARSLLTIGTLRSDSGDVQKRHCKTDFASF